MIRRPVLRVVLRSSGVIEVVTGFALLATPSVVIHALVGSSSDAAASLVARVLGGALLGLGVAGLAGGDPPDRGITLAFVIYNFSTAAILVVAELAGTADGSVLWPVAALHAVVTAGLIVGSLRGGED
jgi:hypothetical protein